MEQDDFGPVMDTIADSPDGFHPELETEARRMVEQAGGFFLDTDLVDISSNLPAYIRLIHSIYWLSGDSLEAMIPRFQFNADGHIESWVMPLMEAARRPKRHNARVLIWLLTPCQMLNGDRPLDRLRGGDVGPVLEMARQKDAFAAALIAAIARVREGTRSKPNRDCAQEWVKKGKADGRIEDILVTLETRFGELATDTRVRVRRTAPESVDQLFRRALTANSLEAVFADSM